MQQRHRLARLSAFCLAILPALLAAALILKYSVDVPHWDQWDIAYFFDFYSQDRLRFRHLFAPLNEYRQFFPNLVFVALGWLTRWDVRFEMFASFALACLISFNVYRLGEKTLGGGRRRRLFAFLISNLIIFSPVQYENWLFGVQLVYFFPAACMTTAVLLASSDINLRLKFLLCACLATVSTFSSANGILCWVLVLPVMLYGARAGERRPRAWLILLWTLGFMACAAAYLYGYGKPSSHPSLYEPLRQPGRAVGYFLAFLGGPLAASRVALALPIGFVAVAGFILSGVDVLKFRADEVLRRRTIVWLMIGAYSILTALMVTFGRLGFGVKQSLTSRYVTFSLFLILSLVYLVPIMIEDFRQRGRLKGLGSLPARLVFVAAAALFAWQLPLYAAGIKQMRSWKAERLRGKACLLFVNILTVDDCLTERVYPQMPLLKQQANSLDRLGFLRPPLINHNRVREFEGDAGTSPAAQGAFESLTEKGGQHVASGRAMLPRSGEPAHAVLLSFERGGEDFIFALSEVGTADAEEEGPSKSRADDPAWRKTISPGELPPDASKIKAWAFDAQEGRAYRLGGEHFPPQR